VPVLFYGRETWSITQKNEKRVMMLENKANSWTLPVGSDWRKKCKLYTGDLFDVCSTPNIIRVMIQ
jgi:hypothetical protein